MAEDLSSQIQRADAQGFTSILEELIAGESSLGNGHFLVPVTEDLTDVIPTWALLSNTGAVYAQGNCQDFIVIEDSFGKKIRTEAQVNAPSTLPPSSRSVTYQLRWSLIFPDDRPPRHFVHSLKVLGLTTSPIGTSPTVEMEQDLFTINLVIPRDDATVAASIYGANNAKLFDCQIDDPTDVAGGYLYSAKIDPASVVVNSLPLVATLDPYIASWKVTYGDVLTSVNRFTGEVFIVNSSILSAVEDSRRMVMKARTTQFGFEDAMFDVVTILAWLRRGRDLFNAASGVLTEFSMTNATGGVREYWLRYSEVAMLLSQALAEGEKAFNFSGQAISLEVDKSQVYQSMADNLQQKLDNDIKPFKQNLLKKGVSGGDGNITGVAGGIGASSMLGISLHPANSYGGRSWMGRRY